MGYGGTPFGITVMYLVTHSCGYGNSRIQYKSKSSIVVPMLPRCRGKRGRRFRIKGMREDFFLPGRLGM
jgi:hypothetical protein